MFIQTSAVSDENKLEFYPGQDVFSSGPAEFTRDNSADSPMAERILNIDAVSSVTLMSDKLLVEKAENSDWADLKTPILTAIMQHYESGDASVVSNDVMSDADNEIIEQVKDLLDTRIVPAVTQSGGDVAFHSY